MTKKTKTFDIYNGEKMYVWSDEEYVFITIFHNDFTFAVPIEDFSNLLEDFTRVKEAWNSNTPVEKVSQKQEEKLSWEREVDNILKDKNTKEVIAHRLENMTKILSEDKVDISEDWKKCTLLFILNRH